ncbi:MAG: EamA family transporter [Acidobacteria bacterium]|nr:MAG: EamA family transporter [Acidobacteriota bacterium]
MPPVLMAGVRFFTAGTLLLAFSAATGRRVAVGGRQLAALAVVGILLLSIANSVLAWAEIYVPTGLAALIVAIVPVWFLLIERYVVRKGESARGRGLAGVVLGAAGMVVLLWPRLVATSTLGWLQLLAAVSLLGSSFVWALGSVLGRHLRVTVDPLVGSAWQMAIAGTVNLAVASLFGQWSRARWDWTAGGAILYLIVFGSWVGYSAYIWLLRHVPTSRVSTYAYVNPVIAVFLGWLILGERIDGFVIGGTLIIIPAVALAVGAQAVRSSQ